MRRYAPLRQSLGTVIPLAVRNAVRVRDGGCVGPLVGMALPCKGGIELDHVRASHAMGRKSETTVTNLVSLCNFHHLVRTEYGRIWRPRLVDYIGKAG